LVGPAVLPVELDRLHPVSAPPDFRNYPAGGVKAGANHWRIGIDLPDYWVGWPRVTWPMVSGGEPTNPAESRLVRQTSSSGA
jgi:hypothetical protein